MDSEDLDGDVSSTADVSTPATPTPAPPVPSRSSKVTAGPLKAVGQFMECGECTKRFTVVSSASFPPECSLTCQTNYTKEHPTYPSTWLCVSCCYALGIDPFAKAKKPTKKAPLKKEDRAKIVHYEERKGVKQLGDMCIQVSSLHSQ